MNRIIKTAEYSGKALSGAIVMYSDETIERFAITKEPGEPMSSSIMVFHGKPASFKNTGNEVEMNYTLDVRSNSSMYFMLCAMNALIETLVKDQCPPDILIDTIANALSGSVFGTEAMNPLFKSVIQSRIKKEDY